jgi:hypothetical protein
MNRRDFVTLLGGTAATARAQQRPVPVTGFLCGSPAAERLPFVAAFREGL